MSSKIILVLGLILSCTSLAADAVHGLFMVVKGDVKVSSNGAAAPAKVGGKIMPGDSVITGADSRAKLVMSDKNVINISPDSTVKIEKYENDPASGKKNVTLSLDQGKIRANVEQKYDGDKSKFLIKTPTAVAGVRGTQFMTAFNPSTRLTEIVTFKGAVSFSALNAQGQSIGPTVMVKKGETTSMAPGAPPAPPKAVPKEDLKKMDSDSTASSFKKEGDSKPDSKQADSKGSDKKSDDKKSADQKSSEQKSQDSVAKTDSKQDKQDAKDSKQEARQDAKQDGKTNSKGEKKSDNTAARGDGKSDSRSDSRQAGADKAGSSSPGPDSRGTGSGPGPANEMAGAPPPPPPMKMVDQKDLDLRATAPDFRAPAAVDTSSGGTYGGAAPSPGMAPGSAGTAPPPTTIGGGAAPPPPVAAMPPLLPMMPPPMMLPPPPNPLLNTIISNKVQNVNLTVRPVPQ